MKSSESRSTNKFEIRETPIGYSIREAISKWRRDNPKKVKTK